MFAHATVKPVRISRVAPAAQVAEILAGTGAQVRTGVRLADCTTLRVGGSATVAECESAESLRATITALDAAEVPLLLLAGGSNLVIGDAGFEGVVVRIRQNSTWMRIERDRVTAEAGVDWDTVVAATVAAGYGGLECLSGIPGSVGATPVQNVGAYGVEVDQVVRRVELLDRSTGRSRWVGPDELGFGYRTSVLKHSDQYVVLTVEYQLDSTGVSAPLRYRELAQSLGAAEGQSRPAAQVRAAVLQLRAGKGMVLDPTDHDTWSAGSFFTNPVVTDTEFARLRAHYPEGKIPHYPAAAGRKLSAGWLIEHAGFGKGFPGPDASARLSTKHTLALTNRGSATATDLLALAATVRAGVAERFGITLTPEPILVNAQLPEL